MTTATLSPGQRDRLARLGIPAQRLGRVVNTLAIPKNDEELDEVLNDASRAKEVLRDTSTLAKFIKDYRDQAQPKGGDLDQELQALVQKGLRDFLIKNGADGDTATELNRVALAPQNKRGSMLTSHKQATAHNSEAPGAVLDGHFTNSLDYARTIWYRNAHPDAKKIEALRNAAGSVSPSDGGFLVPETLRSQLMQIALEQSIVRPQATVVPMDSARVPFPMIDSTTNVGSVFGGMIAYWGEESAMLQDSSPKFGRVTLDAKKLTGLSAVPNELLQDSIISFSALIETLWPKAIAFAEDTAFQVGSGDGEPLGFRGAGNPAAVTISRASGGAINYVDITKMFARMLPSSLNNAVWMASPDAIPSLLQMSLTVGTGGNSVFVVNAAAGMPMTILGRPLIITEKGGTLGNRGDLVFADLSYYLVGDRQTMSADNSADYRFGNDQTTYRIIQRVDGTPWLQSPITPANGSTNKLSPFVELL